MGENNDNLKAVPKRIQQKELIVKSDSAKVDSEAGKKIVPKKTEASGKKINENKMPPMKIIELPPTSIPLDSVTKEMIEKAKKPKYPSIR